MEYKTFKVLKQAEIEVLYNLPIEELKELVDDKYKETKNTTNDLKDLQADRPFHVMNGNWNGVVVLENNKPVIRIDMTNSEYRLVNIEEIKPHEDNTLEYYYHDEYQRYGEIRKVYNNRTTRLTNANPNCKHEIIGGDNYSGIKCVHCKGWYCA